MQPVAGDGRSLQQRQRQTSPPPPPAVAAAGHIATAARGRRRLLPAAAPAGDAATAFAAAATRRASAVPAASAGRVAIASRGRRQLLPRQCQGETPLPPPCRQQRHGVPEKSRPRQSRRQRQPGWLTAEKTRSRRPDVDDPGRRKLVRETHPTREARDGRRGRWGGRVWPPAVRHDGRPRDRSDLGLVDRDDEKERRTCPRPRATLAMTPQSTSRPRARRDLPFMHVASAAVQAPPPGGRPPGGRPPGGQSSGGRLRSQSSKA